MPLVCAPAQELKDGFYRARNTVTGRYITVTDDYGRIDLASTTADLGAIQTWGTFDKVVSNPGSVIYSEYNPSAPGYRLYCQGTDTYKIISYYLSIIKPDDDEPHLWIYAKKSGMVAYLCDEVNAGVDSSSVEKYTTDKKIDTRLWDAIPLTTTGENYFGMKPTLAYGGAYYLSFMASFPFSLHSPGMNVYYVNQVDARLKVAVMREIGKDKSDVPGATPLIARCSSDNPSANRLDIHNSASQTPSDNMLRGVYFMKRVGRTDRLADQNPHTDVVKNDTATMRVLGILPDGSLGMKVYQGLYMPKNSAYLSVAPGSPKELRLVSEEEYEKMKNVKVSSIALSPATLSLETGTSAALTVTVLPADATDKSVTWTTTDTTVAKVSDGVVTAVGEGNAVITATANDGSGVKAQCGVSCHKPVVKVASISLSDPSLELAVGSSATLTATVLPADATDKSLVWSSSAPATATVSAAGEVRAVSEGSAVIRVDAKDGSGKYAECEVHCYIPVVKVTSVSFDVTSLLLAVGAERRLAVTVLPADATSKALLWSSSDEDVAVVRDGTITAVGAGKATITATSADGGNVSASCEVECYVPEVKVSGITLDQTMVRLPLGSSAVLSASVLPENATNKKLSWTSSDPSVASVAEGVVVAVAEGKAVITAQATDGSGASDRCDIEVYKVVDGIVGIAADSSQPPVILDLSGRRCNGDPGSLHPGIYIVNGKKIFIR